MSAVEHLERNTCVALREYAREQGLSCTDTKRLFWGTYGYYLKSFVPDEWIEERTQQIADFWAQSKHTSWNACQPSLRQIHKQYRTRVDGLIEEFIETNAEIFERDEYYYQTTSERVTFYLKCPTVVRDLLVNNPEVFTEISTPRTEAVEKRLTEYVGTKTLVRQNLWWDRFDYKVDFKYEHKWENTDARVANLYLGDSYYSISANTRTLYVNGEDDYFLVKIALKDLMDNVTNCVLNSDAELDTLTTKCV